MLKKVAIKDLKVGMFVVDTGLSWLEHPYLYSTPGEIASQAKIKNIQAEGFSDAFIDTERGSWKDPQAHAESHDSVHIAKELDETPFGPPGAKDRHSRHLIAYEKEFAEAQRIYTDSIKFAKSFMDSVRKGTPADFDKAEGFVEEVIDSVTRNADVMVSLSKLRTFDEYTYTHCINVSVLAVTFGRCVGLHGDELKALGVSGLYHDVGKALVPSEILNKPGKLTPEEFEVMKTHPYRGFATLKAMKGMGIPILRGVVEHHEKFNGQGYPLKLAAEDIHLYGRQLGIVDVYDALTSERVYKSAMPPYKAMSIIFGLRGVDFFPDLTDQFIKCLGIWPVGGVVRLADGRAGVVSESNPEEPLYPSVRIIRDENKRPVDPYDLVPRLFDQDAKQAFRIVEALDPRTVGVDPSAVLAPN